MPGVMESDLWRARVGDARLTQRLVILEEALSAQPTASIPQACGTWARTKAAYRLLGSSSVTPEAIRAAHAQGTVERTQGCETVLVVQDTTCKDFTSRTATTGLGPLPRTPGMGLFLHSALAVTPEGVPQGLVWQTSWARDPEETGKSQDRKRKPTEEKESVRWLVTERETLSQLPNKRVVTVADREADIFDLLRRERRAGAYLLIRAGQDRRVSSEANRLFATIEQAPVAGERVVRLNRREDRPGRDAKLRLRYLPVTVEPPTGRSDRKALPSVACVALLVEEEGAPDGETPVRWLLLTTLPVTTLEEAWECVRWYSLRWLVERYHYVLKSGCRVEELQLKAKDRLETALALYAVVAWRLLWLTYLSRKEPEASCERVFEPDEWRVLLLATGQTPPPPQPPPLRDMVRALARLGGFLGRKHDGEPGVKVLWRGWQRLSDLVAGARLQKEIPPPVPERCG